MPLKRTPFKTKQKPLNRTSTLKQSPQSLQGSKSGLKRGKGLSAKLKSKEAKMAQEIQRETDRKFYTKLYNERGPYSEVSGTYIGSEVLSINYHHIIPKSTWKEGRYVDMNVIILTWEEHAKVENNIHCWSEVNRRRELIKQKYNI